MAEKLTESALCLKGRLASLLLVVPLCRLLAGNYEPGMEFSAVVPGSGTSMKVYVPSNYDAAKKWPLVVLYHGLNGSPTTDCIVRHCGGNDFIVAGVTYCRNDTSNLSGEAYSRYIEEERGNFRAAVQWVVQNLSTDTKRIFLGGISKGGWTTSFVGERELKNLAGFIVLLAGRQRGAVPGSQAMTGFPVYLGAGQTDPNLLSAAHAAAFYRNCGASVSFEEFAGIGHQVPTEAEGLQNWLEAYGPLSHPWQEDEVKTGRRESYRKAYEEALAFSDKEEACRELRKLIDDPRLLVVCGQKTRSAIVAKLNDLAKEAPDAARELRAESSFYEISWDEWNMKSVEETSEVLKGYERIRQTAPGTRWAGFAEKSHARLEPVYRSALQQMEAVKSRHKTQIPPPNRSRFRNSSGAGGGVGIF